MTEREFALDVVRKLQKAGFTALWAGGCVRDELLGLTPADYDVATNAEPKHLRPLFKHRNEIGAHFGVVQVIGPRGDHGKWLTVEVATFRLDGPYGDGGRRPDWVKFCNPDEDAKRRDFTINGMFFDPVKQELIDHVGGRADLHAKVLRAIGDPTARSTEDKLRILRAVRMATRFDLAIDPATLAAAQRMAPEIQVVSAERIAEELRKLFVHRNRVRGVRLLREFGLLEVLFPEVTQTSNLDRVVRIVENLGERASFPLGLTVLLLDVGKPNAEFIADRLRLSTAEKTRIAFLVEKQRYLVGALTMRLSKLKPILVHAGIDELLALHRAIALADGGSDEHVAFCERMIRDIPPEELNPPPAVTGDDLIAMGLKPGREFKRLLDAVRDAQLEGQIRTKSDGLQLVRELRSGAPPASGTPPA
jgi:poly(A) polymerase